MQTQQTYTPPLWNIGVFSDPPRITDYRIYCNGRDIAHVVGYLCGAEVAFKNARLITAAVNSYAKHFGPKALDAAEGDALGRLIEAVKKEATMLDGLASNCDAEAVLFGVDTDEWAARRKIAEEARDSADALRAALEGANGGEK